MTRASESESSSPVGSSARRTDGVFARATARPARARLAAGQLAGSSRRPVRDAQRLEQLVDARTRVRVSPGAHEAHVVLDAQVLDEVPALPEHADVPSTQAGPVRLRSVAQSRTVHADVATRRLLEARQAGQQGRLARAGRTGDHRELAGLERHRDPAQGTRLLVGGAIELVEVLAPERGFRRHFDQASESLTIFHGSTLSAPTGPERVRTTVVPSCQNVYRSKASCTTLPVTGSAAESPW